MKGELEACSSAPEQPFGLEVSALGPLCPSPAPQEQARRAFPVTGRLAAPGHKKQASGPKTFQRLSGCFSGLLIVMLILKFFSLRRKR